MPFIMARTAELADVILPAAGCFEKTQLNRFATRNNAIILQNQVIELVGESWPDWKIVFELGRRIGLAEDFPWDSVEAAIDAQLDPAGVTVELLRQNPDGVRVEAIRYEKYRQSGFATASGKFEFYSARLAENGHDGLPYSNGCPERLISFAGQQMDFPFIGISGARDNRFTNSQYHIIPALLEGENGCVVDLHPHDGESLTIESGDQVEVVTPKGAIRMVARISTAVHPGSVRIAWGWGEYRMQYNLNSLTDDDCRNPVTGTPGLRTFMCRVRKVKGGEY
jgi:anaerobic selenocysteine-containing dehydrogenase